MSNLPPIIGIGAVGVLTAVLGLIVLPRIYRAIERRLHAPRSHPQIEVHDLEAAAELRRTLRQLRDEGNVNAIVRELRRVYGRRAWRSMTPDQRQRQRQRLIGVEQREDHMSDFVTLARAAAAYTGTLGWAPHYRIALGWALGHGTTPDRADQFATDYAEHLEELPANTYLDTAHPTPAEYADDNVLDYGDLVDTTPIGTVLPYGTRWIVRCTTCAWNPTAADAADFEHATHTAAGHNSESHYPAAPPAWGDVAAWATTNGAAA